MSNGSSLYSQVLALLLIISAYFAGSYVGKLQSQVDSLNRGVPAVAAAEDVAGDSGAPQAAPQPPQPEIKAPTLTDGDYIRGSKAAKVTLVEYSDLECPFCKRFHPTMLQVMKEYEAKVKWVYRHYPLPFHANAQKGAEAAECAGEIGGNDTYWKFIDGVFEGDPATTLTSDGLFALAGKLGIKQAAFKACLDSGQFTQKVKDQMAAGSSEGVSGTPGTIIVDGSGNVQFINGAQPIEAIKPMLDKALAN